MGIKFKKSVQSKQKNTKKINISHYWISGVSTKELIKCVEKSSTRPKLRQKANGELIKRGKPYEQKTITDSS
jgi:hypothetical protein